MNKLWIVGLAVALAACTGRTPEPVAIQSDRDASLTCSQLEAEIAGNEEQVRHLYQEENESQDLNLLVGSATAAIFPPVAAVGFDLSHAQEVEIKALHKRNGHLEDWRVAKGCITEDLVPQGYAAFERGEQVHSDGNGRIMTLRNNTYVYRRPAAPTSETAQAR